MKKYNRVIDEVADMIERDNHRRSQKITFRVNKDERKIIDEKLSATRLKLSTYCRLAAMRKTVRAALTKREQAMLAEVVALRTDIKRFASAVQGATKNLNPEQRERYMLNGMLLTQWSELIVRALDGIDRIVGEVCHD